MSDDRSDQIAVRIAVRRELHRFVRQIVGLLFATVGLLVGLGSMVLPFVGYGGSLLFGAGMIVAALCSWLIVGATAGPNLEGLTDEPN